MARRGDRQESGVSGPLIGGDVSNAAIFLKFRLQPDKDATRKLFVIVGNPQDGDGLDAGERGPGRTASPAAI